MHGGRLRRLVKKSGAKRKSLLNSRRAKIAEIRGVAGNGCNPILSISTYDGSCIAYLGNWGFELFDGIEALLYGSIAVKGARIRKMVDQGNPSLAEFIAVSLKRRGVKRIFGIPGGGSSLDIIDASAKIGIEFVLAQTETAAALMAATTAELTGTPGVALTGIGPGAASAVNGVAYASLERAPVVLLTDCNNHASTLHQAFDQRALFQPLVKNGCHLTAETADTLENVLDSALELPFGPVHIDLSAKAAGQHVSVSVRPNRVESRQLTGDVNRAHDLLRRSRKPIIIAGLDARSNDGSGALHNIFDALAAPVLCTYKAKGVVPDNDPHFIGMFTGAVAEAASIAEADLIVFFGFDPVEIIPAPWRYTVPVLELATVAAHRQPVEPTVTLSGPLDTVTAALEPALRTSDWASEVIAALKQRMAQDLSLLGTAATAETVTRALQRAAPISTRLTVDSGAHMFAAMAFWQASAPFDVLKSNGLSTMGYALPAAIASVLVQPEVPVAALTGDGGMMMCLGELSTASRAGGKIVCVVVNDARLSLIDIKQQRQQRPSIGVRYPRIDFATAAEGLGCRSWRVGPGDDLDAALTEAFACEGPAVVDVEVDPSGYGAQLEALRG
jgi:acetolactate synthase-1/2/3 large subunit